ncbi:16S rRNA (adenine(1518)-N(6)/adenine(1519)-N(6)) -dimethyltransferase RsmA [Aurantivibrio plasticivorans]
MDAHKPRKRFGQNFLTDSGIINKIVRSIAPHADQRIVEIGPGQAAITKPLLESCPSLHVVELDRDLVERLESLQSTYPQLTIHSADALKFNFAALADGPHSLRVVGNLPYNISTPLIMHLLASSALIKDMHFMLQKEVVDRIAASPGNKNFGRLSVMVQYFCDAQSLFPVPPEFFYPPPKVNSAIVRLAPYESPPHTAENFSLFRRLVASCFQHRRKTLRNNLKSLLPVEIIEQLSIDVKQRPDQFGVEQYVALANEISTQHASAIL